MAKANFTVILILFVIVFLVWAYKVNGNPESEVCINKNYELYKKNFMSKDGRIIDYDKNGITTSEGQSYMLLRSVVMNDRPTFDLVYKWTKDNLKRPDNLFAWLWGKNSAGKYRVLDDNSASDADVDIAFALILAYKKFNNLWYLHEAVPIINSIWNYETKRIDSYLVLMPGVKQTSQEVCEINPSYFSPYAFRWFQKYDDLHDWNELINSSYYYLDKVMAKTQTNLPPNWFSVVNGEIVLEDSPKSDFSYDAVRVFPRIYLDYIETGEKRALPILEKSEFFIRQWEISQNFYVNYKADGEVRNDEKFAGSIAVLIPIISIFDKDAAKEIYNKELKPLFQNEFYWQSKKDYYGKNLSWFGCYLYNKN